MFVTSLKLTLLVIGAVSGDLVPLIVFGRWVRSSQPQKPGQDRRHQRARQRNPERGAHRAGLHPRRPRARTSSRGAVEESFVVAILRTRARAVMTAVAIFAVFGSIVGVGWVGAQDVIGAHA